MERVYEDHENLVENCLMWTVDSKNTLWFIERPEKYDVFVRPERYLLGTSSSQQGDTMEDHARQELLEEYFSSTGNNSSSNGTGIPETRVVSGMYPKSGVFFLELGHWEMGF